MYGRLFAALLLVGLAACSGTSRIGSNPLPVDAGSVQRAPLPAATSPVTAPVLIPYPFTETYTTTTWSGPSAKPSSAPGTDGGTITVAFSTNKKTGSWNVLETVDSKVQGYQEVLNSAIAFPPNYRKGTAQIILSDNYAFGQGAFSETGQDTYPQGQNSFDFPLATGRRWSAAASHTSFVNELLTGKGAFEENIATNVAATGQYVGQTNFSSLNGSSNHDNYASTVAVSSVLPSVYTVAMPAAGFNPLTQIFSFPNGNNIAVSSVGKKPLPVKPGTTHVPDWYPGNGALPLVLYSDDYVVIGPATMPAQCGKRKGQSGTEVDETFFNLDPVQGTFNTYTTNYYMSKLATGQYWFACILENFVSRTYANGWIMSAGSWGKLISKQVGTEALIAGQPAPSANALHALASFHVLPVVGPLAINERMVHRH